MFFDLGMYSNAETLDIEVDALSEAWARRHGGRKYTLRLIDLNLEDEMRARGEWRGDPDDDYEYRQDRQRRTYSVDVYRCENTPDAREEFYLIARLIRAINYDETGEYHAKVRAAMVVRGYPADVIPDHPGADAIRAAEAEWKQAMERQYGPYWWTGD